MHNNKSITISSLVFSTSFLTTVRSFYVVD